MHIWTDEPVREIWHQLRYLKSPANLSSLMSGRIRSSRIELWPDSDDLKRRAYEISSCIEQADQYFHAAQGVGLATKPLLQFYGAQALAKALIVASDNAINLNDLRYHGLSTRASIAVGDEREVLQRYSNEQADWTIEEEFAVTHDGVFLCLAKVVGDKVPAKGQVLRFKELLRITPDFSLFARHYGEPSHTFYLVGEPKIESDGCFFIRFFNTDKDTVRRVFPEFGDDYEVIDPHNRPGFRSRKRVENKPDFGVEIRGAMAGTYFVRPHPSGIVLPLSVNQGRYCVSRNS